MKRLALILTFTVVAGLAQTAAGQKPAFEVASIKPNTSGNPRSRVGADGGRDNISRFIASNASLRMLVLYAYPLLRNDEIIGGPSWIDANRFDIEAKPVNGQAPLDQIQLMLQSFLADRFQLKVHMETRDFPIYHLVVAKDQPKIKLSEDQTVPPIPPAPSPSQVSLQRGTAVVTKEEGGLALTAKAVPIVTLISMLQGPAQTDRRIFDKTNLRGLFDFRLQFVPELKSGPQVSQIPDNSFPSLFTAIQEQLGLKLESARGPVEVLVIDSVNKPTEN